MKAFPASQIRNVALVGHGGSGKTTLCEAMLYLSGAIARRGRVEDGTSTSDFDAEEQRRQLSLSTSILPLEWKGVKINLLDTPGYSDFVGEVKQALRVADSALITVCAVNGVEVGTELVMGYVDENKLPALVAITRLDRDNADFDRALEGVRSLFGRKAVALQYPLGHERSLNGFIDIVNEQTYVLRSGSLERTEIPEEVQERVQQLREELIDSVAESNDDLLAKYLDGQEISAAELLPALQRGVKDRTVVPVVCSTATLDIGVSQLLDVLRDFVPSPEEIGTASPDGPLAALVFKTTSDPYVGRVSYFRVYSGILRADAHVWNSNRQREERVAQVAFARGHNQEATGEVPAGDLGAVNKLTEVAIGDTLCTREQPVTLPGISFPEPCFHVAVEPKTKGDLDKMGPALARLQEEDRTIRVSKDPETGETILSGMGDMHLEVAMERLRSKFKLELVLQTPRVPYRETIRRAAKAQGRHKKQTGGHGQFGDVWVELEPLPNGGGYEFVDKIVGGAVPRQFIPAVDKGIQETLAEGLISGNSVVDVRATLYDGSYHPVDSSEMAFRLAAALAVRKAAEQCQPVLLEPVLEVEVTVPEANMGDVMSDLNSKRARIEGIEPASAGVQRIRAQVPQAEMLRYAIDLRSLTQGRGVFTSRFSHYEEAPAHVAQKVIEEYGKGRLHESQHV
ncbi:MAG: elongation factor G [Chloroflexi bacterium]|nr:elongation factor G [Chloroflexota bacterium]